MSKRVHSNVEHLLKHGYKTASPQQLRDSAQILILAYLEAYEGVYLTPEQKVRIVNATSLEDIAREGRRVRKLCDSQGNLLYPSSRQIEKGRREKQEQMRKQYSPIQDEYAATHAFNQAVLGV